MILSATSSLGRKPLENARAHTARGAEVGRIAAKRFAGTAMREAAAKTGREERRSRGSIVVFGRMLRPPSGVTFLVLEASLKSWRENLAPSGAEMIQK